MICDGEELHQVIALALAGYPLDSDFDQKMKTDDGSLKSILTTSEYRKLRWAVKSQLRNVVIYTKTDSDNDDPVELSRIFGDLRSVYGNQLIWVSKTRKMEVRKCVSVYNTDCIEYKEVIGTPKGVPIEELNFMIVPIHIWQNAASTHNFKL